MVAVVTSFISILATVLTFAIIIRALMSWVMPTQSGSGLMRVLFDITEPVLAPVRRILPPVSGIDFSPILAIILIQIVNYVLLSTLNAA